MRLARRDWTHLYDRSCVEHLSLLLGQFGSLWHYVGNARDVLQLVACRRTILARDIYEDDLFPFAGICLGGEANFVVFGAEEADVVSIDSGSNCAVHVAVGVFDIHDDGTHE